MKGWCDRFKNTLEYVCVILRTHTCVKLFISLTVIFSATAFTVQKNSLIFEAYSRKAVVSVVSTQHRLHIRNVNKNKKFKIRDWKYRGLNEKFKILLKILQKHCRCYHININCQKFDILFSNLSSQTSEGSSVKKIIFLFS